MKFSQCYLSLYETNCVIHVWQVYLLIHCHWSNSLCHFLLWLYWDCDEEWMLPLLCILVEWLQQLRYDQKLLIAKYYSSYTHTHYIHGLKSFVFFISLWNVCAHACIYLISIISSFLNSTKYSILVVLLILVELGCAAFIYFDKSWETVSCVLSFKI